MKRFLIPAFLLAGISCYSATVYWDGEGLDGQWITAANWSDNIIPGNSDEVILDNSLIMGNYTVTLPAGAITIIVQSLTITPSGSNNILLLLPSSSSAAPGLSVTGAGDALVLNNGAIFKNSSAAESGSSILIVGVFRINNGARYIHNTSRGNANIVSQLSTTAGTELGIFEYDVPSASYILSLSGRTYGTLELSSSANHGTVSYIGAGANVIHVNGDMRINQGVRFNISMTGDFVIHGNYEQAISSTFNVQSSTASNTIKIQGNIVSQGTIEESGTGQPMLELNGSIAQTVSMNELLNNVVLKINNPAGINLLKPLLIPYQLQLVSGKIRTSPVNILTIPDTATYTGGSMNSFIEGPIKKIGASAFDFPIGVGEIYAPIGISAAMGAVTDEFIAEYKRENPQSTPGLGNVCQSPLDHVSYVEYWMLGGNTGVSARRIKLTVSPYSFAKDINSLSVSRFENGQWENEGAADITSGSLMPPYITGTLTSINTLNSFGAFTLGSSTDVSLNPLPVELIFFNGKRNNNRSVTLEWKLAGNSISTVEVQRSGVDRQFKTIDIIFTNTSDHFYTDSDKEIQNISSYYRLKMTNEQGGFAYSRTIAVPDDRNELQLISLSPGPVSSKIVFDLVSVSAQPVIIMVVDMEGRIRANMQRYFPAGKTTVELPLDDFSHGIYQLLGIVPGRKTNILRFLKK